jgi:hypothetical protein
MSKRIEYTAGDFIGDEGLIFIEDVEPHVQPGGHKKRKARFLCTCGKDFEAVIHDVNRGHTTSCGCVNLERTAEMGRSTAGEAHGKWRGGVKNHYLYGTWRGMMTRCFNKSHKSYENYGGRGIEVCPQWHDSKVFLEFCDTVLGQRPEGHSLDRIDNDKGYFPGNVRWASAKDQANNRRSSNE